MTTAATPRIPAARAPSADDLRRQELAAFLRSRRERLTPGDVGLPDAGRRRTPGLRREEVALLAGVGVTWYTWLEQARDIHVSEQVLGAIARSLLLDSHERSHLFTLAGAPLPAEDVDAQAVTPEIRAILDKLDPFPSFVSNGRYDLLAYNRAYRVLVGDLDALPVEERNSLWLMFAKETTSRCFVDRDDSRARMVAQPENARKRILHCELGLLQFTHAHSWLAARAGLRLVTYVPADEATAEALQQFDRLEPALMH